MTVLMSLLLCVGMVCVQVCNVSCAVQGEPDVATSKVQHPASSSGHCHGQASESIPLSQNEPERDSNKKHHSSDCLAHGYAEAIVKSGKVAVSETFQQTSIPVAELFQPLDSALDRLADEHARTQAYHSPPARAVISVLRI